MKLEQLKDSLLILGGFVQLFSKEIGDDCISFDFDILKQKPMILVYQSVFEKITNSLVCQEEITSDGASFITCNYAGLVICTICKKTDILATQR